MLTPVRADAYTRRQVLVDRRFQLKYVAGLAAGGACMCAAFGGAVWLAVHQARESLGPEAQPLLEGTETTVVILTLFMALLMAAALALVALLVTHRIAGPVRVLRGQFRHLAEGPEAAGRKLNVLLQEMGREANTIGSKANDVEIAHAVVIIKEELERLREQVQNVE